MVPHKRVRITYVSNSRLPTGRAHGFQIMTMCAEFAKLGAEVELILPAKRNLMESDPFEHYRLPRTFAIRRIPVPDFGSRISFFPGLFFILDVFAYALALLLARIGRSGGIVYCRDYPLFFFFNPRRSRLVMEIHDIPRTRILFRLAIRRVSLFIAITRGIKDELVELGIASEKILVAPDGVRLEDFENPESREEARRRLGLPMGAKIAMYIGWIDYWKGTDTLFAAAARLKGVQTVVIGALETKREELARAHPEVHFFSMRPYHELADNQQAADVLVLPTSGAHAISTRYTSPLKLFTYMASGIPIVAADVPSLREILDDRMCFWYRVDDAEDLARVIEYALKHQEEGAKKALIAKELVKRYTWRERAKNILTFIRDKT